VPDFSASNALPRRAISESVRKPLHFAAWRLLDPAHRIVVAQAAGNGEANHRTQPASAWPAVPCPPCASRPRLCTFGAGARVLPTATSRTIRSTSARQICSTRRRPSNGRMWFLMRLDPRVASPASCGLFLQRDRACTDRSGSWRVLLPCGVRRVAPLGHLPEQAHRLPPSGLGRPRAVLANGDTALRRVATAPDTIREDVALGAARRGAQTEAAQFGIPDNSGAGRIHHLLGQLWHRHAGPLASRVNTVSHFAIPMKAATALRILICHHRPVGGQGNDTGEFVASTLRL
jgi:hypothetical protein